MLRRDEMRMENQTSQKAHLEARLNLYVKLQPPPVQFEGAV